MTAAGGSGASKAAPPNPLRARVVVDDPASYAEDHLVRIKRLERELASARKWSMKSTRQLHAAMLKDVRAAERRARQAERRAVAAEERLARAHQRVRAAEAEAAAVRESATWRAGRVLVAVPARLKRWGGG